MEAKDIDVKWDEFKDLCSSNILTQPTEYKIDWDKVKDIDDIKTVLKFLYGEGSFFMYPENAVELFEKEILKIKQ